MATLIESNENGSFAYDSLLVSKPEVLKILGNKLALKIMKELSKSPACAIDVARKLKVHEQKIYYHIRKLEKAGFIYSVSSERRHGMTAKIYNVVSPVIAAKIFEKGVELKESFAPSVSKEVLDFFYPFINDGKLNAKIIFGDTVTHGRFDESSVEAPYTSDIMIFLGKLLTNCKFPTYQVDTLIKEKDLKNNLILFGNNRTNVIIDKINSQLPVCFNPDGKEEIFSKITKKRYTDPRIGFVLKSFNPFNENRKILLFGNIARRGMVAISIALTQNFDKFVSKMKGENLIAIVQGTDKDGDGVIDSVKFLE